ncbi:hypothetical protein KHQ81_03435 [Mycoplasmatota bacterium]|nr:hypothetical protein KHQ81_03435 [Mycoplasmatota bacterium]
MGKERKKKKFEDDGRTIASMNFDYMGNTYRTKNKKIDNKNQANKRENLNITNKEKWAMIKALYLKLIPIVLIIFFSFFLAFFLLSLLW